MVNSGAKREKRVVFYSLMCWCLFPNAASPVHCDGEQVARAGGGVSVSHICCWAIGAFSLNIHTSEQLSAENRMRSREGAGATPRGRGWGGQ